MVPAIFANYFLASSGAGAALIGLLFVAVSLRPDKTLGGEAHPLRMGVASGAFTALTNAFFVSMSALIPLANVGDMVVIISAVDIIVTLALGRSVLWSITRPRGAAAQAQTLPRSAAARVLATLGISGLLYAYEGVTGVGLLLHPRDVGFTFTLTEILLGVYAVGLVRAWELLGGQSGVIGRLTNPLHDLDDLEELQAGAHPTSGSSPAHATASIEAEEARTSAPKAVGQPPDQ
ncbi:MAG TPA: hypothetical protein VE338_12450 [Ktedonobacterales bacterium]|jgi:hypothetical protein|nr:hypothetical protein [Ktedonobacterales bacterium]